jgi:hypothetical protein
MAFFWTSEGGSSFGEYLIDREKGGGAVHIFSIFYTHHRVPNEHMMTIKVEKDTTGKKNIQCFVDIV